MTYRPTYSDGGNWILIGEEWVRLSDGYRLRAIKGGTSANTVMENIWAFGDDDGSESGHSLDTENTARTSQAMDTPFMVRMMARETAGKNDPWAMFIYCSYKGGAWTELSTTSSASMPAYITNDASSRADEEATTHRLSNPAGGSFTAGEYDDGTTAVGCGTVTLNGQYSEWEFCVAIDSTYAAGSEDFEFRLEGSGGTDLNSYAGVTYPKATTTAGAVNLTVRPLSQANTVQKAAVTTTYNMTVAPLSQANTVDKVPITKESDLVVDPLFQSNLVEFITGMTQQAQLIVSDLSQSNLVEHITLVQIHSLQVDDLSQSNLVEHVSTTKESDLVINDLSQSNLVEFITGMTQQQQLVVYDLSQSSLLIATYFGKLQSVHRDTQIGYWPLDETAGGVIYDYSKEGNNGSYTGVDLADSAGPDGPLVPYFDGANDYGNIYSAGLAADFNGDEGTALIWIKVTNSGVWTDATQRYFLRLLADANNYIGIRKDATSNQIKVEYVAGSTYKQVITSSFTDTGWFHLGLTWSKSADAMKCFLNGSQTGATQTALGTWSGTLVEGSTLIGAQSFTGPLGVHDGWLAHGLIYNDVLPQDVIQEISSLTPDLLRLEQQSNITVDDLSQSNLVEHIDLTQLHILQVDDLSQNSTVEKVNLTQVHVLAVDDLSQSNTVEKITLSTEGAVVGYALSQANTVELVSLTQIHNLSVDDLSQATTVEKVNVNTSTTLTVADLSVNTTVEVVTLVQIHNLSVDDLAQSNLVLPVVLTQIHVLAVDDLSQANSVPLLPLGGSVSIRNLTQANTVEKVSLTQVHNLSIDDLSQSNLVTVPNVNSQTTLTIGDLSVSNTVEKVSLTSIHNLSVDDLSQGNIVEEVILSQVHVLSVHDLSQANSVPYVPISGEGTVTPFSLSQTSLVETVTLVQEHNVSVYDLSQSNAIESIALVPVPKLVIYDLAQANSTDHVGITTTYNLMVYDLAQVNTVDYAVWGAVLEVYNLHIASRLWNSSFWQEQFEWQVGIYRNFIETAGIDTQSDKSEVDL